MTLIKRAIEFLIRNLGLILLSCLLVTQILIWRALVDIQGNVDRYGCGRIYTL